MDGGDGGQSVVDEFSDQRENLELVQDVEVRGWLIQQQDAGLLRERAGEEDALALAAGECFERPGCELAGLGQLHRIAGDPVVRPTLDLEAPQPGVAAHEDQLEGGEALRIGRDLGDQGQQLGDLARRERLEIDALQRDRALLVVEHVGDRPQEGRFAGPVGTDQAHELTAFGAQVDAIEQALRFDAERDRLCVDGRGGFAIHAVLLRQTE